jgi:hypothetical protein
VTPRVEILQLDAAALRALADGDLMAANDSSPVPLSPYLGLVEVGEQEDDEDGLEIIYELAVDGTT